MESFARLIHKSFMTYMPTRLPVQFYGLPDGKVYVIYARFYEVGFDKSGVEYVFGIHEEFLFDYENEKLYMANDRQKKNLIFYHQVDKPNPKIKVDKVYRGLNSFGEALIQLNKKAQQLNDIKLKGKTNIIEFPKENDKLMSI